MICGGGNSTIGCHLAVFSVDLAIAHHFVVIHPPYRSASGIGCVVWGVYLVALTTQPSLEDHNVVYSLYACAARYNNQNYNNTYLVISYSVTAAPVKIYLKWQPIQLAIQSIVGK